MASHSQVTSVDPGLLDCQMHLHMQISAYTLLFSHSSPTCILQWSSYCELSLHCSCAAVIDGHGGLSSAAWLQQHLYEDVLARVDQTFLQPDPAAQEVPGRPAVVRPSKLEETMIDAFHKADEELLQHLLGG